PDAVAGTLDHVIRPALVPDVAVLIHAALVAGAAPVADELLPGCLRVLPVLEEEHRILHAVAGAVHGDFAELAARTLVAGLVDDRNAMPRIRPADGAGLHRPGRLAVADHVVDLGLAEHLVDGHSQLRARPFDHRDANRFARAHDGA